jgi:microcystin-dependent protein
MSVNFYDKVNDRLNLISGGTLYADAPVGAIQAYGGITAPSGWLLCQGQAVSRTEYADLFKAIGTAFGTGDGSTTFNIPDLRGEFLRGAGTNSHANQGDGGSVGEHQDGTILDGNGTLDNQMRINKHNSSLFDKVHSSNTPVAYVTGSAAQSSNGVYGTVRPTNTSVNYIIKATIITLPSDFEAAVDAKLNNYVKTSVLTSWTNVTSKAVSFTGSIRTNTIQIFSNGYECKIIGELILDVAQSINQGWIDQLVNISINNGYRPKTETSLSGFFAANSHSPIIWSLAPSGKITGFTGTTLTEISRIPINGTWSLYN